MSDANIAIAKRWFEEVWNQRRTATITELFAPNGISHGVAEDGSDLIGPQAFIPFYERFLSAFPDMKLKIEDAIADGDKVLIRWSATMRHTGDGLGLPPRTNPSPSAA
jgi:predicted ester cyclase